MTSLPTCRELSFTWDIYALNARPMSQASPFNLTDPALQRLVSQLQPFMLRVSGTGCENTQLDTGDANYIPLPSTVQSLLRPGGGGTSQFNVTTTNWDSIGQFAMNVGGDLLLGLNQLLRDWPGKNHLGAKEI